MYEHEGPKLRLTDDHRHRVIVQPSLLLRPGALALITPPNQRVILLDREDVTALRDYLTAYLTLKGTE